MSGRKTSGTREGVEKGFVGLRVRTARLAAVNAITASDSPLDELASGRALFTRVVVASEATKGELRRECQ